MIFADFPIDEAEGLILAHSLPGVPGTFKKGRRLSADDLAVLRAAGLERVTGVRLESGDVTENQAADRVAGAVAGRNVERRPAFTGRSNLFATVRGLANIDRRRLEAVNGLDEALTVATVAPGEIVKPGQMIATIKVIPFAVEGQVVDRCAAFAAEGDHIVSVSPFLPHQVGLVLTALPGTKEEVLTATAAATRERVEALDGRCALELRRSHQTAAVAQGIGEALAAGCSLVLVAGASATVDRRDVVPAAIVEAGGAVDHFGMPVDPGNLMLLGHVGTVPVLGLPGCARSPKLNGLDWVLRRLMAGLPVTSAEIASLGAGGLLKETRDRPLPRAQATPPTRPSKVSHQPRIGAVILAAGQSRRMGRNKLLIDWQGKPFVAHVVDAALAAALDPVVVVTGHDPQAIQGALAGRSLTWADNPAYAEGMAGSVKAGLARLPDDLDGVVVCLGDMPALTAAHLRQIVGAFDPVEGRAICVPTFRGRRGNPVLLASRFFPEMRELSGDAGARGLIRRHGELVCEVPMDDDAVLTDVDTDEALTAFAARAG